MRFSISSILALTLVVALFVSWRISSRRLEEVVARLDSESQWQQMTLRADSSGSSDLERTERLLALCEEPIRNIQFPSALFQQAQANFERLKVKSGQLEITDPDDIAVRSVPVYSGSDQPQFECRIYVPEDQGAELEFFASLRDGRPLEKSVFDLEGTVRFRVPSGESLVQLFWFEDESATNQAECVEVLLDGKSIFDTRLVGIKIPSGVGKSGLTNKQLQFRQRSRHSLVRFSPKGTRHFLNLILKKVSNTKADQ